MANIPLFIATGTHFEVGYQIGTAYHTLIHRYYEHHPWLEQLEDYYCTTEGQSFVEGLWAVAERRFPQYVEELKGMASASGIDFIQVKLLHLERELTTRLGIYQKVLVEAALGCSDILINNPQERLIGHNEDWHTQLSGCDILLYARIQKSTAPDGSTLPEETFLVHTWPGLLPGTTFGFTSHGYAFSVDHLFPKAALEGKTPEAFICRHLLTSRSTPETLEIAKDNGNGSALGFSLNFGFLNEPDLWNVEMAPTSCRAATVVDSHRLEPSKSTNVYTHFNNYKRIMDPALVIPLCQEREMTFASLDTPRDMEALRAALGNTSGQFPIFQDVEADYKWATVTSVILDLNRREMQLFRKNPKLHEAIIRIPFTILPLIPDKAGS